MIPPPELPEPPILRPYEDGAFRMALGLGTVPTREWLRVDRLYGPEVAERRALIAERAREVVIGLPEAAEAGAELLGAVAANLAEHHPAWFGWEGGRLANRLLGEDVEIAGAEAPLATLGRLVQEDFCLMRVEGGVPRLVAGVLCFPNRWRLAEKIGLPLGGVHGPVPLYAERLQRPVDRFLALLAPGKIAVRANWSVLDDPALHQPVGHGRRKASSLRAEEAGARLFLRVERQSFVRLPRSGAVVFGIRSYVWPLGVVVAAEGEAARLRAAVLAMPEAMAAYKSLLPFRAALLEYLEARAAG
ncbi:DUF3445 domain-containing protein [Pseudoroseomonas globiformis]|uniref:DUF3445 domain-containing protein n=1 Tax=Teichococcus globiformis TaxID=2307229 RepID=A0ABV7G1F2_9PROT